MLQTRFELISLKPQRSCTVICANKVLFYNGMFLVDDEEIMWLNGKPNCSTECDRIGGGPCPSVCGERGYCCKRPELTDEHTGSCPDIAKWSVLPIYESKWRCVAPPGGPIEESIDQERGNKQPIIRRIYDSVFQGFMIQ